MALLSKVQKITDTTKLGNRQFVYVVINTSIIIIRGMLLKIQKGVYHPQSDKLIIR